MKKRLLLGVFILSISQTFAQGIWTESSTSWIYDLGSNTGKGENALTGGTVANGVVTNTNFGGNSIYSYSSKTLHDNNEGGWLPYPPSGTALVRLGGTNPGYFDLVGSSVQITGGWGAINKMSTHSIVGASAVARFHTKIKFGTDATAGSIRLGVGNASTTSSYFNSASNPSSTATESTVFALLNWTYSTTTKLTFQVRRNLGTGSIGFVTLADATDIFEKGGTYDLEIYCNNTAEEKKYTHIEEGEDSEVSVEFDLPARSFHIWVTTKNSTDKIITKQIIEGGKKEFPAAVATAAVPELALETPINAFVINTGSFPTTGGARTALTMSAVDFTFQQTTTPVSLISFTAQNQNNAVKLNWATASEQNNSHFDVLRSSNGKEFHSINTVAGEGNSTTVRHYSYSDYNPVSGTNYYKLRQVDFNGTSTESEAQAVSINIEKDESFLYQEGNSLLASIYSGAVTNGTIKLSSVLGSVLLERQVRLQPGYTNVNLGNINLQPGMYVAYITVAGKAKSVKFLYGQ